MEQARTFAPAGSAPYPTTKAEILKSPHIPFAQKDPELYKAVMGKMRGALLGGSLLSADGRLLGNALFNSSEAGVVDAFLFSGDTSAQMSSVLLVSSLAAKKPLPLVFSAESNGYVVDNPWTWSGCFFFATTVASTIGYGTWAPATVGGKIFTIVYALFAVGIFGVITGAVGEHVIGGCMVFLREARYVCSKPPGVADFGVKDHARAGIVFLVFVLVVNIFYCASPAKYFGFLAAGETTDVSLFAGFFWFSPVASLNSIYFWVVTVTSVGLGDFADWPMSNGGDAVVSLFCLIVPMGVLGGVYGAAAEGFFAWWYREKEEEDESLPQEFGMKVNEEEESSTSQRRLPPLGQERKRVGLESVVPF